MIAGEKWLFGFLVLFCFALIFFQDQGYHNGPEHSREQEEPGGEESFTVWQGQCICQGRNCNSAHRRVCPAMSCPLIQKSLSCDVLSLNPEARASRIKRRGGIYVCVLYGSNKVLFATTNELQESAGDRIRGLKRETEIALDANGRID